MKKQATFQTLSILVILTVALVPQVIGQTAHSVKHASEPLAKPATVSPRRIVVSLEDRKLALVENGEVKKVYTVAVGKPSTPSPVGTYTIERRVANPTYAHKGQLVEPGPGNPVGTRWMGLSVHGYGIHGTNAPKSIGKAASHGCIRMAKGDLEELFELVRAGDTVEIVGQRNEETAQLFQAPALSPASVTETQSAQVSQPVLAPAAVPVSDESAAASGGAFMPSAH